jgi:rRNA maturation endonuclease Nob1
MGLHLDSSALVKVVKPRVDKINLQREVLDDAANLSPGEIIRSLDAIHLALALSIGADLRAVITYDQRMTNTANAIGLAVEAPS